MRRAEGKVRINAQLVDASTGRHVWADRYDRDYKEIFALQDEVIGKIVSALAVELTDRAQAQRAVRKTADVPGANGQANKKPYSVSRPKASINSPNFRSV